MKIISITVFVMGAFFGCTGNRPGDLGVREGKLKPCPDSPNCVSSQASKEDSHFIEPITYISPRSDEQNRLKTVISSLPRTQLIKEENGYLYYEFTSLIMRYVDDVEFYLDDTTKLIHIRSASRLGKSDLGVNRKRIETIRKNLLEKR